MEGDGEPPASLKSLAEQLNPVVGYYDPLKLGQSQVLERLDFLPRIPEYAGTPSNDATVGFLRHAEIKHGRVAMAAFVGYCLQANGVYFPWKLTSEISHADISAAGSPPEQWDALPSSAKLQILGFIGFLEWYSEYAPGLEMDGLKHYMRGGIPGKFPTFNGFSRDFHPVPLNLYDPFKLQKKMSRQTADKRLLAEINNGRLAMLGIMAFLAESKLPNSVPVLSALNAVKPYSGEVMAPFSAGDAALPLVAEMLKFPPLQLSAGLSAADIMGTAQPVYNAVNGYTGGGR
jgi:hypothetical protein